MSRTKRITLYFTNDSQLSAEDIEAMNQLPGGAFHRNASFISPTDRLEECDFVSGPAIPQQYVDAGIPVVGDGGESEDSDVDLARMTVPQLKALAADRGIEVPDGSKKADIIALLSA